jgi:hypothetical protein
MPIGNILDLTIGWQPANSVRPKAAGPKDLWKIPAAEQAARKTNLHKGG